MSLHLIKLSVGSKSLSDLEAWQTQRLHEKAQNGEKPELIHVTRNTPRRAAELLDGGSIYWVIKGMVCGRQRLLELRPLEYDGIPHCGIVYAREMVPVTPRPHRPFQGWRYLQDKDASPDMTQGGGEDDMPEEMRRELGRLGLL